MRNKLLALGIVGMVALGNTGNAQTWSENFNSGFPSGWTLYNVDGLTPYANYNYVTKAWVVRQKKDANGNLVPNDSVIVSTSWYSPAGVANDWVVTHQFTVTDPKMVLKWDAKAVNKDYADGYEVLVSTTGNMVTDFTTVLYSTQGAPTDDYTTRGASLAAYNGQQIYIAFRNNSNDKELLGLDNISTLVLPNANDVSVEGVILPRISASDLVAVNGSVVKAVVSNKGAANITSVELSYTVDAGTPVTQTFTGLNIGPYNPETLTFTTGLSGINVGAHTLTINAITVNGGADANTADNQKTTNFAGASQTTPRAGIIEEFSSSTCAPCASFNAVFDPFIAGYNVNIPATNMNVIKYQMNWPPPGTDASYNSHGVSRKDYYGVSGIPAHYTNGNDGTTGDQAELDASKTDPAFMSIEGSYIIGQDSLKIDVAVNPHFSLNGGNYRVYIAAVEKDYNNNKATTTQKYYVHVMRQMYPNGDGNIVTSWTGGTPQTYSFTKKYDVGGVVQGNYHFWTHPKNSTIVVFVQDNATKDILQSKVIEAAWPADVKTIGSTVSHTFIYPNPAKDKAIVAFELAKSGDVAVHVFDAVGRMVYSSNNQLTAGVAEVAIPTANFAPGLYTVKIQSGTEIVTERLSVTK